MKESPLTTTDPATRLPHRNPFLFLDRITLLEPGVRAEGVALLTHSSFFSPVLLVEMLAQLAGVAAVRQEGERGALAAVDRAELCGPVQPGDCLMGTVRIVKSFGRLFLCEGEVTVGKRRVAAVTLTLGVGTL